MNRVELPFFNAIKIKSATTCKPRLKTHGAALKISEVGSEKSGNLGKTNNVFYTCSDTTQADRFIKRSRQVGGSCLHGIYIF